MTLIDNYLRRGDETLCQITMRAADQISFAEATRRMRDLRRVIEGLTIRQGRGRTPLPQRLRYPSSDKWRRPVNAPVWQGYEAERSGLEHVDELRMLEVQRANAVWQEVRRDARVSVDRLPVRSIHYGSPYEILFAIQTALLPGGLLVSALGALYTIPKVVGAFTNMPTQHAQQLAEKEAALLRRERIAAARTALREQVPVENEAFAQLSSSDAAVEMVAEKLEDDESVVARGLEQIEAVRIETNDGRSIDSDDLGSLDY